MTYVMFNSKLISEVIKDEATKKSYRQISKEIKRSYPNAKASPSTLCRIANKTHSINVDDIEIMINHFGLNPSDLFIIFPF